MAHIVKRPTAPAKKIADCELGGGRRIVVAISAAGYVKTPYSTLKEPEYPADARESKAPRGRSNGLPKFGKGKFK